MLSQSVKHSTSQSEDVTAEKGQKRYEARVELLKFRILRFEAFLAVSEQKAAF